MARLPSCIGCLVIAVALALPAAAQSNATFVLESGERISGELVEMGGVTVEVNGRTRNFSQDEIAVIDFVGTSSFPDNEVNQVERGRHLLVLRDGRTLSGRLVEVSSRPGRITFNANGVSREFRANDVARIYLGRPEGASPAGWNDQDDQDDRRGVRTIQVPGDAGWVNTGIRVVEGQRLMFRTTGQIRLSTNDNDVAGPGGAFSGRTAANAPLRREAAGALIGRIDNGQPFGIGDQREITAPATGVLYLAVNDDVLNDNVGSFTVRLSSPRGAVRRP
ncbi:MAG TPA: hypothetical protein VF198_06895 [Vicinamibacterales bacterium]